MVTMLGASLPRTRAQLNLCVSRFASRAGLAAFRALALLTVILWSYASYAADASPVLTLASAVDLALKRNPDLMSSRYELTAAQARILQAGLRPNPELNVGLENFAGTGAIGATKALETTLALSQVIEIGGKRLLRRSVAEADRDQVSIEQSARELDVIAEVTRRFIAVVSAQERLRILTDSAALARQSLENISRRVAVGRSPVAERSRAQIAVTRAGIARAEAESVLKGTRYALVAMWGDPEPSFQRAQADLFSLTAVRPLDALLGTLSNNPDLLRFASEARLRDAELRLAQAQARPNPTFNVGVRHLNADGDAALVAGVSLPLAVYDRNQGGIRQARARRAQSEASLNAANTRLRASLYVLYAALNAARIRFDSLQNVAIPQAQEALGQVRSGFDRGRFSFLELGVALQELIELQQSAIDAATDYHNLHSELERLTSAPLESTEREAPLP